MKKIIAACLSILVGAFGYTIAETAIDTRVSNLEAECSSLKEIVSDLCELHNISSPELTTKPSTTYPTVIPSSIADIAEIYNYATTLVESSKPGFKKINNTQLQNLEMGAIGKLDIVRESFGTFFNEGSETITINKGSECTELVKSTLTANDILSATCKISNDGKFYEIIIVVKPETDPDKSNSILSKYTNDFKDINEIQYALNSEGASSETINSEVKEATITAKISVSDLTLYSVEHNIKIDMLFNKLNYIVTVKQASLTVCTNVSYSDFIY